MLIGHVPTSTYVTGLRKQGMWAHDFYLLFQSFWTHNFLSQHSMKMKISALSRILFGIMIDADYRMKIFYFITEIWPLEGHSVVCARMPCFCRPGHKWSVLHVCMCVCVWYLFVCMYISTVLSSCNLTLSRNLLYQWQCVFNIHKLQIYTQATCVSYVSCTVQYTVGHSLMLCTCHLAGMRCSC